MLYQGLKGAKGLAANLKIEDLDENEKHNLQKTIKSAKDKAHRALRSLAKETPTSQQLGNIIEFRSRLYQGLKGALRMSDTVAFKIYGEEFKTLNKNKEYKEIGFTLGAAYKAYRGLENKSRGKATPEDEEAMRRYGEALYRRRINAREGKDRADEESLTRMIQTWEKAKHKALVQEWFQVTSETHEKVDIAQKDFANQQEGNFASFSKDLYNTAKDRKAILDLI